MSRDRGDDDRDDGSDDEEEANGSPPDEPLPQQALVVGLHING